MTNLTFSRISHLGARILLAPLLVGALSQETASSHQESLPNPEDAVILSVFEVDDSRDVGYLAQNTLAGSRLNTSLKDTAAPISVFTKEFMEDPGVTNLEELLDYAPNIETEHGEETTNITGNALIGGYSFRIRGLPGGSRARNYFRWGLPVDTFNTDRID
ncbi:MAG: TonB-dependent receptor plug domain-containing protein [Opitutaceae bacterium]